MPSGSSAAGSGGGGGGGGWGREAWFQAAATSVDVRDTDSVRVRTIAWRRLDSSCTQLRHFWPWTKMLPFLQYRCMTNCFRSPWCSLAVVWHSSAGMADTHGHPLSCSLPMSLCCRGWRECHQCLPRSASCVSPRHPVREDTRPRPTVISGPCYRSQTPGGTLHVTASGLPALQDAVTLVVSGPCTKVHNTKDAMTENSYLLR